MADSDKKPERTLWMLGIAITLPMVLVSGPVAGFVVGRWILVEFFGLHKTFIPICVGMGFLASGLQTYRLIQSINQSDSNK